MYNNTMTMIIEKGYDLMSIFYNNKKLRYRNRIQFILYRKYLIQLNY